MMRIELILDPNLPRFTEVQADLNSEIQGMQSKNIRITTERVSPPPGTLAVDEVVRFVIEHHEAIGEGLVLLKALVEVVKAVMARRKTEQPPQQPGVVVVVGDRKLKLPASSAQEKAFLKSITTPLKPSKATRAKGKGARSA